MYKQIQTELDTMTAVRSPSIPKLQSTSLETSSFEMAKIKNIKSLRECIDCQLLTESQKLEIAEKILYNVYTMHHVAGIAHLDLNPNNIQIRIGGE